MEQHMDALERLIAAYHEGTKRDREIYDEKFQNEKEAREKLESRIRKMEEREKALQIRSAKRDAIFGAVVVLGSWIIPSIVLWLLKNKILPTP